MPPRGTSLPTCGATTRPTVVGPGRHCLQRKEEEREKEKREERERERESGPCVWAARRIRLWERKRKRVSEGRNPNFLYLY